MVRVRLGNMGTITDTFLIEILKHGCILRTLTKKQGQCYQKPNVEDMTKMDIRKIKT